MKLIAGIAIPLALVSSSAWADAADGKAVFESKCRACHGADGKGNPSMVKAMGVKPIGGTSQADTKAAVTKGKNKMKPIASVTGKQLDDVAAYVSSLK